jgi:tetratricopeptide (TPR) repeat protein
LANSPTETRARWLLGHARVKNLVLLSLLFATPALADDLQSAREHYHRATTLFDLRRYDEAVREYEKAFESKDDPALLFNIGQAYRLGGRYEAAIGAFRSYLRRQPAAKNRAEVMARIHEMQDLVDQQKATNEQPPQGTLTPPPDVASPVAAPKPKPEVAPPPPVVEPKAEPATVEPQPVKTSQADSHPGRSKKIAGLVTGVIAVAAVATGAAFAVLAAQDNDSQQTGKYDANVWSRGPMEADVAYAMFGVAGAAAVATVALEVLGFRESRAARFAVTPSLSPAHAGLSATVRF